MKAQIENRFPRGDIKIILQICRAFCSVRSMRKVSIRNSFVAALRFQNCGQ